MAGAALLREDEHYLKRELDAAMREDPSIFEFIQGDLIDGLWYWNLEKPEDEWMSPAFWQLLGYDPERMPHKSTTWQDLIFREDLEVAAENFLAHCADPEQPYDQVVRYRHANGSTVWVRCRGRALRDASGRAVRMVGAHEDVTTLMLSCEALRRRTDKLEASNRQLSEFAHRVAHDLRSPLGTLGSVLSVLEDVMGQDIAPRQRKALDLAFHSASQLRLIVDGLLDLAQVGMVNPRPQAVDLGQLLREIELELRLRGRTGQMHITRAGLGVITSDPGLLRRILSGLLDNAVKYCKPEQPLEVRVGCETLDDGWRISVADNGIGIAAQDLERIFEPLCRLPQPHLVAGGGLGLAICRAAAEALGGQIRADSVPSEGSSFRVELPRPR